jgi:hypothetical protein
VADSASSINKLNCPLIIPLRPLNQLQENFLSTIIKKMTPIADKFHVIIKRQEFSGSFCFLDFNESGFLTMPIKDRVRPRY